MVSLTGSGVLVSAVTRPGGNKTNEREKEKKKQKLEKMLSNPITSSTSQSIGIEKLIKMGGNGKIAKILGLSVRRYVP